MTKQRTGRTRRLNDAQRWIMGALIQLSKEDRYAVAIQQFIEERADIRIGLSTIWDTLETLDRWGYVDSALGETTPQRGGRRKRLFELNGTGELALQESRLADAALGLASPVSAQPVGA